MVCNLRRREEGFGPQNIAPYLEGITRNNLEAGLYQAHTIKFPDPVLSVMDRHVFTLKKLLKCWDRFTMELKWQYPPLDAPWHEEEHLFPLFKIENCVLCVEEGKKYFKVLSLDRGEVCAMTNNFFYQSIHKIGERVFIKEYGGKAFEFLWKENRLVEVDSGFGTTHLNVDYNTYDMTHQKAKDLGFSPETWHLDDDFQVHQHQQHLAIFQVENERQMEAVSRFNNSFDYAVNGNQLFKVVNGHSISLIFMNSTIKNYFPCTIIYKLKEPGVIRTIFVHDRYLILEVFNGSERFTKFLELATFKEVTSFDIKNVPYSESDYSETQTCQDRSLYFNKGSYFRFMGSYLQVLDFNCKSDDINNHPLYTVTDSGFKIGNIQDTDDLKFNETQQVDSDSDISDYEPRDPFESDMSDSDSSDSEFENYMVIG